MFKTEYTPSKNKNLKFASQTPSFRLIKIMYNFIFGIYIKKNFILIFKIHFIKVAKFYATIKRPSSGVQDD